MILTGVTGHFCAAHRMPDDVLGQREWHGHSYEVTAWFRNEGRADARVFKAALNGLLSAWDHKELPADFQWGEDIARAVGTLANCVEVEVRRPLEGLHARWREETLPLPLADAGTTGTGLFHRSRFEEAA